MRGAAVLRLDVEGGAAQVVLGAPAAAEVVVWGWAPLRGHAGQHIRERVGLQGGGRRSGRSGLRLLRLGGRGCLLLVLRGVLLLLRTLRAPHNRPLHTVPPSCLTLRVCCDARAKSITCALQEEAGRQGNPTAASFGQKPGRAAKASAPKRASLGSKGLGGRGLFPL